MSNKRSSVAIKLLFTLAAFTATLSLFFLYIYVSTADERVLKSLDSAKVLVSTKTILKGTSLNSAQGQDLIEIRSYPVRSLPKNSLQDVNEKNGYLVALGDIAPGQILLEDSFGERAIPKVDLNPSAGQVAVTVELSYGARLGTFLKPGIKVSLYATYTDNKTNAKSTKLLFDSIEILAIGGETTQKSVDPKETSSNFVTFSVDVGKADGLIQAAETASLYIALPNNVISGNK